MTVGDLQKTILIPEKTNQGYEIRAVRAVPYRAGDPRPAGVTAAEQFFDPRAGPGAAASWHIRGRRPPPRGGGVRELVLLTRLFDLPECALLSCAWLMNASGGVSGMSGPWANHGDSSGVRRAPTLRVAMVPVAVLGSSLRMPEAS
ncbi:hypothetical protein [Cognatazoarcus halotolerans]|uniref:hypothetical protein n=1 Tax=Cognatazoarcus halotolerans TaxID=2686016 RepID=UPI001359E7AE|nr:hypothetical protein [Cognatazoarcus halotolerans]MCA8917297.1 hypothetical protein [Planctomycetota bacterium]